MSAFRIILLTLIAVAALFFSTVVSGYVGYRLGFRVGMKTAFAQVLDALNSIPLDNARGEDAGI